MKETRSSCFSSLRGSARPRSNPSLTRVPISAAKAETGRKARRPRRRTRRGLDYSDPGEGPRRWRARTKNRTQAQWRFDDGKAPCRYAPPSRRSARLRRHHRTRAGMRSRCSDVPLPKKNSGRLSRPAKDWHFAVARKQAGFQTVSRRSPSHRRRRWRLWFICSHVTRKSPAETRT